MQRAEGEDIKQLGFLQAGIDRGGGSVEMEVFPPVEKILGGSLLVST